MIYRLTPPTFPERFGLAPREVLPKFPTKRQLVDDLAARAHNAAMTYNDAFFVVRSTDPRYRNIFPPTDLIVDGTATLVDGHTAVVPSGPGFMDAWNSLNTFNALRRRLETDRPLSPEEDAIDELLD